MSGPAQEKQLRECFSKFDVNGDGKIGAEEFRKLMGSLGEFSSKEITRLFSEADSDGSGGVDWREFLSWICSGTAMKGMGTQAAASFERLLNNETRDEATFVEAAAMGEKVTSYLKEKDEKKERKKRVRRKSVREDCDALGVPNKYTGHRIPVPMTHEGAKALLEHFLNNGDRSKLHKKQVMYLIDEFFQAYRDRHRLPVVRTEVAKPAGRLIVVGDTHGQLADVLYIIYQLGPPTATNRYLFNGDMVDRGQQGVEILLILYSFFLADPESIILHRGNHENEDMNALDLDSGGGFADEVMQKYDLEVYRNFANSFRALSLCSVINQEVFVVHGGLTRVKSLTLDYIDSIPFTECTAPPPTTTVVKEQIFSDLVWSDPVDNDGKFKSDRGVGIKFGGDVTTKFCSQNRLRFMVRSHQVPEDGRGFFKQHSDRCVTVFSASNYCGDGGNFGAVIVLSAATFPRYEICEHYAPALEEMPSFVKSGQKNWSQISTDQQKGGAETARTGRREKEFTRMIVAVIENKPQIWDHMIANALGNKLARPRWIELMGAVIDSSYPWEEAALHWGLFDEKEQTVDMTKFLGRWIVHIESDGYSSFVNAAIKYAFEAIMGMDMDLQKTLQLFDKDGDGTVDLREAKEVLAQFDLGLSAGQINRLLGQLFSVSVEDKDSKSVRMNIQEFLGRFNMVYSSNERKELPVAVQDFLDRIGALITKNSPAIKAGKTEASKGDRALTRFKTMSSLFTTLDSSQDGMVQISEFVEGVMQVPGIDELQLDGQALTKEKLTEVAKALDVTGDGSLNYLEFLQAFEPHDQGAADLQNSLVEDVTTVLFRHRMAIRKGCHHVDEINSQKVHQEDFMDVLHGVNSALEKAERSISVSQIENLANSMAVEDQEGRMVFYEDFLRSFVILDTADDRKVIKSYGTSAE
eukprot:TRINITY_DN103963_c0_g1_i1.p1 TRINITY_DN103963_c0_g1~~TRINITY_DN103963_c0_g1_i1.p1  ORF type:complete len:921 (+),score=212.05 TRINITY_DN103963_c0_g1_i1:74-2836(+)